MQTFDTDPLALPSSALRLRAHRHSLSNVPTLEQTELAAKRAAPQRRAGSRWVLVLSSCLVAFGCGGESKKTEPALVEPLVVTSVSVSEGEVWSLNRPIDVVCNQALDWSSIQVGAVRIVDELGAVVLGNYTHGPSGPDSIRFTPACHPDLTGFGPGFQAGNLRYRVVIRGEDNIGAALRSATGATLSDTLTISFVTPPLGPPSLMFHDPAAGPPSVIVRGRDGIEWSEVRATHLEIGLDPAVRAYFAGSRFGLGFLDAQASLLLPDGLPLNHYSVRAHRVAFVVHFDQPIDPEQANLDRVGVEFMHGTWQPVPGRTELVSNCSQNGYAVRFVPSGMLPRGTELRVALAADFADLFGEATTASQAGFVSANCTWREDGIGTRIDAIVERFAFGGNHPLSNEDTTSDLGAPRAHWGQGSLRAVAGTTGESRARSKWLPLGLGHINPGGTDVRPRFEFEGTDPNGAVVVVGNSVAPIGRMLGPIPLLSLAPREVRVAQQDLADPLGLYVENPGLVLGSRAVFFPLVPGGTDPISVRIDQVTTSSNGIAFALFDGCYIPGLFGIPDCVPFDLTLPYNTPAGVTLEVDPRYFEIYSALQRDRVPDDARVTILFDATVDDGTGAPSEGSALSAISGWTPNPNALSNGAWDFVRFEVVFELDVSGDGGLPSGFPTAMSFLKLPFDMRP